MNEEGGSLDDTVGHQTKHHEQEGDQEAIEAQPFRRYLNCYNGNIHERREYATKSLSSHHAAHVVWRKLAGHSRQASESILVMIRTPIKRVAMSERAPINLWLR